MSVSALKQMPAAVECGDTLSVTLQFANYLSSAYTAILVLNLPGSAVVNTAGTADGQGFNFKVAASATSALTAGEYLYAVRVAEIASGEVATAQSGAITLLPNIYLTQSKSTAQLQLDAVNAAILALASKTNSTVSFNGQSFTVQDLSKLQSLKRQLTADVAAERDAQLALRGQSRTRSIAPYFG